MMILSDRIKLFRGLGIGALVLLILLLTGLGRGDAAQARWPGTPGDGVWADGSLYVDTAGLNEGYFQAAVQAGSGSKFKLRVTRDGEKLTYDLNPDGEYEVFPLQLGSGYYDITLYRNLSGKEYATAGRVGVNVTLSDPEVSFLYPNQYVSYTAASEAVAKADELCGGMNEKQAYDAVCDFMGSSFVYDYVKAITVKAGVLPDIDGSYSKKMGVCQDLSAIMCCMLRTQGIPARLVIGYADENYHAWVVANFGGKEYFFDPTVAVSGIGKVKTYSVERWY